MSDWWQYQSSKAAKRKAAPKIPPFKQTFDPQWDQSDPHPPKEAAPMVVEESTASDTAIRKIIKFWTNKTPP